MDLKKPLAELEPKASAIGEATEAIIDEVATADEQKMDDCRTVAPDLLDTADRMSEHYRSTMGFDAYGEEELSIWRDGYITALLAMRLVTVEQVPTTPPTAGS